MTSKFPICPDRIRSIPEQFSWVDHRLVRDHHIDLLSHEAAALYLFLITVADCRGLSYYADASLCERLSMDMSTLVSARSSLLKSRLVVYKRPLYQVLPLDAVPQRVPHLPAMCATREDVGLQAISDILAKMAGGA